MRPLQKAVEIVSGGNQSEFARAVSKASGKALSQQLVSKWIISKTECSPKFARHIEYLTGGQVTKEELCPDVFPPQKAAA